MDLHSERARVFHEARVDTNCKVEIPFNKAAAEHREKWFTVDVTMIGLSGAYPYIGRVFMGREEARQCVYLGSLIRESQKLIDSPRGITNEEAFFSQRNLSCVRKGISRDEAYALTYSPEALGIDESVIRHPAGRVKLFHETAVEILKLCYTAEVDPKNFKGVIDLVENWDIKTAMDLILKDDHQFCVLLHRLGSMVELTGYHTFLEFGSPAALRSVRNSHFLKGLVQAGRVPLGLELSHSKMTCPR